MDIDVMWNQINEMMKLKERLMPMLEEYEATQANKRGPGEGARDARGEDDDERGDERKEDERRGGPGEPGRATAHPDAHHDARDAGHGRQEPGRSGRDK